MISASCVLLLVRCIFCDSTSDFHLYRPHCPFLSTHYNISTDLTVLFYLLITTKSMHAFINSLALSIVAVGYREPLLPFCIVIHILVHKMLILLSLMTSYSLANYIRLSPISESCHGELS